MTQKVLMTLALVALAVVLVVTNTALGPWVTVFNIAFSLYLLYIWFKHGVTQ